MLYTLFADGGSRGNPGPAGSGAVVKDESGTIVFEISEYLGVTTNNVAEYTALLRALENLALILEHKSSEATVHISMDSELAVKQMNGIYKIKHPNLKPLAEEVQKLVPLFHKVTFSHVRREFNKEADALANAAMDRGQ